MIGQRAEREVQPERLLRLVSPGDTIEVKYYRGGSETFHTKPVGTDIGEVALMGLRGGSDLDESSFSGVTVRGGKLIEDACENLDINQGLFSIGVEVLQGNPFWPTNALFCRLDIDGIDKSFEAELVSHKDQDDPTPISAWDTVWQSNDPNDTRKYAIFASPKDTALLSRFGFSLYTKPGVKPTLF